MKKSPKPPVPVIKATPIDTVTTEYSDDIHVVRLSRFPMQPTDAQREDIRATIALWPKEWVYTFEGELGPIENYWLSQPDEKDPLPLSLGAYRRDILFRAKCLRRIVQKGSTENIESVILLALGLGRLIEDGRWRFSRGDDIRKARKMRADLRQAVSKAAQERREASARANAKFAADVSAYMRKHPRASLSEIAHALLRTHGRGSGDVALDREALRKRIARLRLRK